MKNEEEIKKLVLARLSSMPDNILIHYGENGEPLEKDDLIEHVKKDDDIGQDFIESQKEYIKATIKGFV